MASKLVKQCTVLNLCFLLFGMVGVEILVRGSVEKDLVRGRSH